MASKGNVRYASKTRRTWPKQANRPSRKFGSGSRSYLLASLIDSSVAGGEISDPGGGFSPGGGCGLEGGV